MQSKSTIRVLLTGGTGYIASHTAVELLSRGYEVVLFDNLSNSKISVIDDIQKITGFKCHFVEGDVRDEALIYKTITDCKIGAVMHFAGLKSVGESVDDPSLYFSNNLSGTISLLRAMEAAHVRTLIFSSSATVYGNPAYLPVDEIHPTEPINPYGRSKLYAEKVMEDVARANPSWSIVCLRYFNPAGAHSSGILGESPAARPNNLLPVISEVASGQRDILKVYGNDYETSDGTGVRDYIHIVDLAAGHEAALRFSMDRSGFEIFNLGTGRGHSVLEVISAFERVTGETISFEVMSRRSGDVASCYANPIKASKILLWEASLGIEDMCGSAWTFVSRH